MPYDDDAWLGDPEDDPRYDPPPSPENEPEYIPYVPPGLHVIGCSGFLYLLLLIVGVHLFLRWIGH